ncbi:hypothetical protein BC834DRAFT_970487 [Gloeopeniophorella convolvens]|nr:hypothetical protein BC834DRAFT_970487 [Gloeopeniophorella convolvens]
MAAPSSWSGLARTIHLARLPQTEPIIRKATERAPEKKADNSLGSRSRSVYTESNALFPPVARLPPELLTRIFRSLQDRNPLVDALQLGWVTVTHVCQRWRLVALEDASLWGAIEGGPEYLNRTWFHEMLYRSKSAPLDIVIPSQPTPKVLFTISQHFSHLRTLSLLGLDESPRTEILQSLLLSEAPLLEEFVVKYVSVTPTTLLLNPSGARHRKPGEPQLFGGRAPKLRKIHLDSFCIPWKSFQNFTLTHLQLVVGTGPMSSPLGSLDQLVDVLIDSGPTLEVLILNYCVPWVPLQSTQVAPIDFPRLYQLDLKGPSAGIARLFESMKLPTLTELCLHVVADARAETISWPTVASLTASHFDRADLPAFPNLGLGFDRTTLWTTTIDAWGTRSIPNERNHSARKASFALKFMDKSRSLSIVPDVFRETCAALRMEELDFLEVSIPSPVFDENEDEYFSPVWVRIFQPCIKVTMLAANGQGTGSLIEELSTKKPDPPKNAVNTTTAHPEDPDPEQVQAPSIDEQPSAASDNLHRVLDNVWATSNEVDVTSDPEEATADSEGGDAWDSEEVTSESEEDNQSYTLLDSKEEPYDGPIPMLFPKLTTLRLTKVNFGKSMPGLGWQPIGELTDLFRLRESWEAPIEELEVYECKINRWDSDTLEQAVPVFSWDEETGAPPDYEPY